MSQYIHRDMHPGRSVPVKNKSTDVLLRHVGAKGERKYSSYSLLTLELGGVSSQRHAPVALYLRGKDPRYLLDRRLDGLQSWSGHRS
jgi:hypothetical protein